MDNQISKALLRKKFSDFKSPIKPDWIKVSIPSNKISQTKNTLKAVSYTHLTLPTNQCV